MSDLIGWIQERPTWVKYAAKQLIDSGEINLEDIKKLVELTINDAKEEECEHIPIEDLSFDQSSTNEIKLTSISDIHGINALSSQKPLEFGNKNLSIIYGRNGSGKSGYVRILKHLTGSRNPGRLLSNVYESRPTQQKCKVSYEINDQSKQVDWEKSDGPIEDLLSVDIYDTSTGVIYLEDENEVTYEPPLLRFFSELIDISQVIGNEIESIINQKISQKPTLPPEYHETELGKWYQDLSSELDEEKIIVKVKWDEEDEEDLTRLKDRVGTESPREKADQLLAKRKRLINFVLKSIEHVKKLSVKNCAKIIDLNKLLQKKEKVAEAAAKELFSSSPLDGIGSDIWEELWEKARTYSESIAYHGQNFPVTEENARCVLCQQELSDEAKGRFISFEEYVKGETNKEIEQLSEKLDKLLKEVSNLPNKELVLTELDAIGIDDKGQREKIVEFYDLLSKRAGELNTYDKTEELTSLSNEMDLIIEARRHAGKLLKQANLFLKDAENGNREEIQSLLKEIETRKWLSTQSGAIKKEVERLTELEILDKAKKITNPASLSRKKGALAEELITEAYINRFNEELASLGACNVNVDIKKTGVKKGQVLHEIQLLNTEKQEPSEVLSEGERKIVTLAAFLADVTGKEIPAPFIFDDPITSLDEDFEDKVVNRLIELSKKRQVIVFTHRISLVVKLQDDAKKEENTSAGLMSIKKRGEVAGEPTSSPIYVRKAKSVLNELSNQRLVQAKKAHRDEIEVSYEILAKSICSDIRILLERIVEEVLLADVVHRFRRDLHTKNKILNLSKIQENDCKFIDDMMTKYSKYEHSQPRSSSVPAPEPHEIEADLTELKEWFDEFTNR